MEKATSGVITIKRPALAFMGNITLIEGESYLVELAVTNISTKAGLPTDVIFGVGISAATQWTTLIPIQRSDEYFLPNETRTFTYTMNVPPGSAGQPGLLTGWVEDPTGKAIAHATEDITIITGLPLTIANHLTVLDVEGIPVSMVSENVGILARPIEMEKIRGVCLHWRSEFQWARSSNFRWDLDYSPAKPGTLLPSFYTTSVVPEPPGEATTCIIGLWTGGPYYPGIYDGHINILVTEWFFGMQYDISFIIKNLIKVTGSGTIPHPPY